MLQYAKPAEDQRKRVNLHIGRIPKVITLKFLLLVATFLDISSRFSFLFPDFDRVLYMKNSISYLGVVRRCTLEHCIQVLH